MLRAAGACCRSSGVLIRMNSGTCARVPHGAMGMSTAAAAVEPEILMAAMGGLRVVDLNRPKALNALNLNMIRELYPFLVDWNRMGGDVNLVVLRGVGERAFCAGGDIKALHDNGIDPEKRHTAYSFFREEYAMNHLLGQHRVPIVSLLDGIVMGGGVGLSVHGRFRVATEHAVFAMPEVGIGFFPDVGGTHFLPNLPGHLGQYLGLSGARLKGRELYTAGIATHFVPSENLAQLEATLVQLSQDGASVGAIDKAIAECGEGRTDAAVADSLAGRDPEPALADIEEINEAFGAPTVAEILSRVDSAANEALVAGGDDVKHWAVTARKLMANAAPTSLVVTHRAIEEGRKLNSLGKCLEMEFMIAQRFMRGRDFFEGVGKMLNLSGDSRRDAVRDWEATSVEEISSETIAEYFTPGDGGELKLPDVKH